MELGLREFQINRRYGHSYSTLMLDIDYFKKINDSYGHAGGDVVLTEFAARCKLALRDTDLFDRIGGDEFLVFLPQTSRTEAFQTANRLLEITARTPFSFNGEQIAVTISSSRSKMT